MLWYTMPCTDGRASNPSNTTTKEAASLSGGPNGVSIKNVIGGSFYYYSRLSDERKGAYKSILSGIQNHAGQIEVPLMPFDELSKLYYCVLLDNPLAFYTAQSFSQSNNPQKQKCYLLPEYSYPPKEAREYTEEIVRYLRVFDPAKGKKDIEKELFVHDFCLSEFSYDSNFGKKSYSVLGLVQNKTAVCEGIAKFVKLAFDYLRVRCLVVTGKAIDPANNANVERHAWNIVMIDQKTYHLDVTFDMTIKNKALRYDYFNLPDVEIKKDHVITGNVPTCQIGGNDYYTANSLYISNMGELGNYIKSAMKNGKRHILVKIKNEIYSDAVANQVGETVQRQCFAIGMSSCKIEMSMNPNQMVFEISIK